MFESNEIVNLNFLLCFLFLKIQMKRKVFVQLNPKSSFFNENLKEKTFFFCFPKDFRLLEKIEREKKDEAKFNLIRST